MSTVSERNPPSRDFDYWEFVHCAICFLSFITDPINAPTAPPSVPFWLTECGHTLCNNHLHADQSCGACGATAIQLVPLQRDMMPPMCDWFRSVPHGLDAIASAAKSQQETMASLVRYYKRKCSQQRTFINNNKDVAAENKALRSQIEQLQQEVAQVRESTGGSLNRHFDEKVSYGPDRHDAVKEALSYQPSETRNVNGKRPLADSHTNRRTSSPRSIITPIAPSRLTLPPDHQQPVFPSGVNSGSHQNEEIRDRPGSSRFENYAYQPPTTTFRAPPLRHQQQQQGHGRMQREQEDRQQQQQVLTTGQQQHNRHQQQQRVLTTGQQQHIHQQQQQQQQQRMPPPPTPSRAQGSTNGRGQFRPAGQIPSQSVRRIQMQAQPPVPAPSTAPQRISRPQHAHQPRPFPMSVQTPQPLRLVQHGPSSIQRNTSTAPTERRFAVPSTPSNRFFPPRSTAGVVVGMPGTGYMGSNNGGSSTRAPFVPGNG